MQVFFYFSFIFSPYPSYIIYRSSAAWYIVRQITVRITQNAFPFAQILSGKPSEGYLMTISPRLSSYITNQDRPYIAAVLLLGSLNHFLYEWSGNAAIIALFCPVNESVWEHLKLLFFPFLFVTMIQSVRSRSQTLSFFYYRFLAVMGGLLSILVLFYTYTGILGADFFAADLLVFLFSVIFSFFLASRLQRSGLNPPPQNIVFSLWVILALCFFSFTCFPPDLPPFFPPA